MAEFQNPRIELDVSQGDHDLGALATFPRALQILVSDAQQVFPTQSDSVNTVFLFAGMARFGQDTNPNAPGPGPLTDDQDEIHNNLEDKDNFFSNPFEVDHDGPKTLNLDFALRQPQLRSKSSAGSASFTALGSVGLNTPDPFGAATDNALTDFTDSDPNKHPLPDKDFWLFSDVSAEGPLSQLNRLGYQATALLQTESLITPQVPPVTIPHLTSFGVIDLDVNVPSQVASALALDVGINDGQQVFPADNNTNGANRLLIFTGIAQCNVVAQDDENIFLAVVRVRLRFPVPPTLILKGSATVAALASIKGTAKRGCRFAVNAAKIVRNPTDGDGGTVDQPPPPSPPLPSNELYLLIDVKVQGAENGVRPRVNRIAYQANVLVQDTEPDLDSILVRGAGGAFGPVAFNLARGATWEYQLTLTGAVPQGAPPLNIQVQSDDKLNVPVNPAPAINIGGTTTGPVPGGKIGPATPDETVTITAIGRRAIRTARLEILTPK